jgi:hypothetical protein
LNERSRGCINFGVYAFALNGAQTSIKLFFPLAVLSFAYVSSKIHFVSRSKDAQQWHQRQADADLPKPGLFAGQHSL